MKRVVRGLLASSLLLLPCVAVAGSQSANLDVSASVADNCTISTTPLAFGAYDLIVANAADPLDGTGTVTITCTQGASTSIELDGLPG